MLFFYELNDMKVTLGQDEAFDLVIGVVTRRIGVEAAADLLSWRSAPR